MWTGFSFLDGADENVEGFEWSTQTWALLGRRDSLENVKRCRAAEKG